MTTPNLAHSTPAGEPLSETLGGSITASEKQAVIVAFDQYGWNQSAGVRQMALSFAQSAKVRDAVFEHLHSQAAA